MRFPVECHYSHEMYLEYDKYVICKLIAKQKPKNQVLVNSKTIKHILISYKVKKKLKKTKKIAQNSTWQGYLSYFDIRERNGYQPEYIASLFNISNK